MFEQTFCSSPWIHVRINNTGHYEFCRWGSKGDRIRHPSLKQESPITFFQKGMSDFRQQLLNGQDLEICNECHVQEAHEKISGRQKQLLKVGVDVQKFVPTMLSSPWLNEFKNSFNNQGQTNQTPQDWQIDLGNYCNSGCVFCNPMSSSWIATEYKKLGLIQQIPRGAWTEDPTQLQVFLDALEECSKIEYMHFIGGETLITPAFKRILEKLIDLGLQDTITIGFTTNLTVWNNDIISLLAKFHNVNLGVSIECVHNLNDYVRYPSQLDVVMENFKKWDQLSIAHNWIKTLRITPTVLSIYHIDTIYQLAWEYNWSVESCNFLNEPDFMRPSLLPVDYRQVVIEKLQRWINSVSTYVEQQNVEQIINIRNPNATKTQIIQDAQSYVNYLNEYPDEIHLLPSLVKFLKTVESARGNKILDYIPEYEELLKSAGY